VGFGRAHSGLKFWKQPVESRGVHALYPRISGFILLFFFNRSEGWLVRSNHGITSDSTTRQDCPFAGQQKQQADEKDRSPQWLRSDAAGPAQLANKAAQAG
jgi:hypothetical protein